MNKTKNGEENARVHLDLLRYAVWVRNPPDYLPWISSETVSFLRPLARREARTLRPLAVAMRERKPCLLFLFLLWG